MRQAGAIAGLSLHQLVGVAIQQQDYVAANDFIARGLARWHALGGAWHIAWLYAYQGDMVDPRSIQKSRDSLRR
jgi:hypothetical protein